MNEELDDALDALLREQFDGPVPDDGFCGRVMDRLPDRPRRQTWPLLVGAILGVSTCWFSLRSAPIAYVGWGDWLSGDMSASAITLFITMLSMTILALAWTIAEADEGNGPSPRSIN